MKTLNLSVVHLNSKKIDKNSKILLELKIRSNSERRKVSETQSLKCKVSLKSGYLVEDNLLNAFRHGFSEE